MKIILIVVGSLAGLYAVAQFVNRLLTTNSGNAYGTANLAASVVLVCLGIVVCVACFTTAFKKPKP